MYLFYDSYLNTDYVNSVCVYAKRLKQIYLLNVSLKK